MKQFLFIEILRRLQQKPNLKRKLKIFALVGFAGLTITAGLLIWVSISVFSFFGSKTNEFMRIDAAQYHFENLKSQAQNLPKVQAITCWEKAQSLMAVEPWVARPAIENLNNLKVACLEEKPKACEGPECTPMKQLETTTEGSRI